MTLEETDTLDIAREKDGKFFLGIVDAGITKDPEERFKKFSLKLRNYADFLRSDHFKEHYPQYQKQKEFEIFVMCADTPTEKMRQMHAIRLKDAKTGQTIFTVTIVFLSS